MTANCSQATHRRGKRPNSNTKSERKTMNNKFDELTRSMAQSVTRRGALKQFGLGLVGMAVAALGMANTAKAIGTGKPGCWTLGVPCNSAGNCKTRCCSGRGFYDPNGGWRCDF